MIRRRTSQTSEHETEADEAPVVPERAMTQGKGRATPSRRDAEKARLETRRGVPSDPRAARKVSRERRNDQYSKSRAALRSGDEANYPARDRGPIKRFCRDYIDSRYRLSELLVVFYLLVLVADIAGAGIGTLILGVLVVVVIIDLIMTVVMARRAARKRFPGEPLNGVTTYVLGRAIFPRRFRTPKPRIKRGESF